LKNGYHLLDRPAPVQGFDQHLVKGIDVSSTFSTGTSSKADPFWNSPTAGSSPKATNSEGPRKTSSRQDTAKKKRLTGYP